MEIKNKTKILFLHGLESKPGGTKVSRLAKLGYNVLNPLLPANDFKKSIEIAQEIADLEKPDFIVGSSRGGAIAMSLNIQDPKVKMVLIAPAWNKREQLGIPDTVQYTISDFTTILHSRLDDVVKYQDSSYLESSNPQKVRLIECGECHRMSDEGALNKLFDAVSLTYYL